MSNINILIRREVVLKKIGRGELTKTHGMGLAYFKPSRHAAGTSFHHRPTS
jgi:hypothetical protein